MTATEPCPTLLQLKRYVEEMIERDGEEAPAAWWIYNKEDVLLMNGPHNDEIQAPIEVCQKVLLNLLEYNHICTAISDCIDREVEELTLAKEAK